MSAAAPPPARARLAVGIAAALLAATPAWAQSGGGAVGETVATVAALAVVCGLAYVALVVLKQVQARAGGEVRGGEELRFVRALPVGARERLVVVRWRGRTLLLGVTAGSIAVLERADDELAAVSPADLAGEPGDLSRTLLARIFNRPGGGPT